MIFSPTRRVTTPALAALALLAIGIPASAQIQNGSFETDSFGSSAISNWNTIGSAYVTDASFGDTPTDGLQQAFLNNDPEASLSYGTGNAVAAGSLEDFLGLSSGALTGLGNGTVTNGSGFSQTFTLVKAETISFDYDFITSEDPNFPPVNKDFAFVSLSGTTSILTSLADSTAVPIAEPAVTGRTSPSIDDYLSETGYKTYTATLAPGSYTLGLGVVNVGSTDIGSGLLIDNAHFTPVPEAGTWISFGLLLGLGGLFLIRARFHSEAKA